MLGDDPSHRQGERGILPQQESDLDVAPARTQGSDRGDRRCGRTHRVEGDTGAPVGDLDDAERVVVAAGGRLALVLRFGVVGDKITEIDIEADPDRLRGLDLAVLD